MHGRIFNTILSISELNKIKQRRRNMRKVIHLSECFICPFHPSMERCMRHWAKAWMTVLFRKFGKAPADQWWGKVKLALCVCIISQILALVAWKIKRISIISQWWLMWHSYRGRQDRNKCIIHCQYHCCWWPDETSSQGTDSHGVDSFRRVSSMFMYSQRHCIVIRAGGLFLSIKSGLIARSISGEYSQ